MYANDEEKELFATASSKTKYLAVKRDGKLYSYTQYIRIIVKIRFRMHIFFFIFFVF